MNTKTMRAVILAEVGIRLAEVDRPEVKPTQVLVKVASCSVNRSDLLTTQGKNYGHVGGAAQVMGRTVGKATPTSRRMAHGCHDSEPVADRHLRQPGDQQPRYR